MSENMIQLECYEMLKAMYNFEATLAKTLSFSEGEHFVLHQSNSKQRNWWQVVNLQGHVGFVPSNYVATVKVEPQFMIKFLEECVSRLSDEANSTADKQELITNLNLKKQQAETGIKPCVKKQAPPPPVSAGEEVAQPLTNGKSHSSTRAASQEEVAAQHEKKSHNHSSRAHDDAHEEAGHNNQQDCLQTSQSVSGQLSSPSAPKEPPKCRGACRSQSSPSMGGSREGERLPAALYHLVDSVRRDTQLSHLMARQAVSTMLDCLKGLLPGNTVVQDLSTLCSSEGPLAAAPAVLRSCEDARRLRSALSELAAAACDAQQRAWALHDDQQLIQHHLEEAISLLKNADTRISKEILISDDYEYVNALVLFYQMETRWHIRKLLLEAFSVMCSMERSVVRVLCQSVLGRELARDMLANPADAPRLAAEARLLAMTLCLADPLPLSHGEQLDLEFVTFLLELIESSADTDDEERIADSFLALVLALNLQYSDPDNNLVLDALQSRHHAKVFTEKLLLLLNREEDPVRMLEHQPPAPHSVLKLTLDAFSRRPTAALFYTNDTKVLLDITVRQLADLSPPDVRRGQYLQLCLGVLRHTDYSHAHRQADLLRCFTRIFCEETEHSKPDQALVRTISNEFPHYFKA